VSIDGELAIMLVVVGFYSSKFGEY